MVEEEKTSVPDFGEGAWGLTTAYYVEVASNCSEAAWNAILNSAMPYVQTPKTAPISRVKTRALLVDGDHE
jgi:hypothetical protein